MRTWKQNLKHLSIDEYRLLRYLCRLSKNVYNESVYNIRQYYLAEGHYLRYESNYHLVKDSPNYKKLGVQLAQQTMKCADASFRSFFALLKTHKDTKSISKSARIPRYLEKDSLYPIYIPEVKIQEENKVVVPMSWSLKHETEARIWLTVPSKLVGKNIRQIHIIPKYNGKYFEAHYVFDEDPVEPVTLDSKKALSIDVGVNNFATCVTNYGDAFIIDGKKLKSINQWYNKELARLSSIKDRQKIRGYTKRQYCLTTKRNRRVADYIYCSAKKIVSYCIENKIGNIVVGYNEGFQDKTALGRINNQQFVMIPFGQLRNRIKSLCETFGITYQEQEESYTSKASFFDNDEMPVWNPRNPKEGNFSGKRINRGLYKSPTTTINADVNAALNILRKSNLNDLLEVKQPRGQVVSPLRIYI